MVTQNDQAESFRVEGDHALEDAVYATIPFEEDAGDEGNGASYQYRIPLADGTMKIKVAIPDTWREANKRDLIQSVITALLIWFVCGGMFTYLLSTKLYQPVEELMGKLPVKLPLSRKSQEFQLLHRTLQNLSEKNEVYKEAFRRQNHHFAYNLWPRVLKGEFFLSPEIMTVLRADGFPEKPESYVVLKAIVMPDVGEEELPAVKDVSYLSETAEFFRQYCGRRGIACYFWENMEEECINGFMDAEGRSGEQIYEQISRMKQQIQQEQPIQISAAVSDPYRLLTDISAAYQKAEKLTEYMILMDDYDSVYVVGYNVEDGKLSLFEDNQTLKSIQKLSNCIQYGQFQEAGNLLDQIFGQLTAPSPEHLIESAREVSYLLDTIIISFDSREYGEEVSRLTIEKQQLRKQSLYTTKQYLQELFARLQDKKSSETSNEEKVQRICEYIETHYEDSNLSAQAVADAFGVGISWLSTTFKKVKNESFLDHIHKYRIGKIQELMMSTDLSLKEIAERTGYGSYVTMTRAFKRYTGVAPKWYREHMDKESRTGDK